MKTNHIIILLLAFVFTFSACREITVTTKVNRDGSFTRTITITGDSAELYTKNLPYPIDDSWAMELKQDSVDSSYFMTYSKNYESDRLLNKEIKKDTGERNFLNRRVDIKKRFGFFYSYLSFEEEIKATNPFNALDINDFLSPNDMQWINNERLPKSAADTVIMDDVEEKALDYLAHSITTEFIQIIEQGIEKLDNPKLDKALAKTYYDSIYVKTGEWEFDKPDKLVNDIAIWSNEPAILGILTTRPYLFEKFNKKIEIFDKTFDTQDYKQNVIMPGLITATNSAELKGNTVSWEVQALSYLLNDYKMNVESRVVNYWMFVLTGLIILVLIILLILKVFR